MLIAIKILKKYLNMQPLLFDDAEEVVQEKERWWKCTSNIYAVWEFAAVSARCCCLLKERNFILATKASLCTKSVAKMHRRLRIGQAEKKIIEKCWPYDCQPELPKCFCQLQATSLSFFRFRLELLFSYCKKINFRTIGN